jgi:hypothetical protein
MIFRLGVGYRVSCLLLVCMYIIGVFGCVCGGLVGDEGFGG